MPDDEAREDAHKLGDGAPEDAQGEEEKPTPPDDEVAAAVVHQFPESVFDRSHGQPVVYVERSTWGDLARFLRDEQQFTQCVDVTAVDHLVDAARREIPGVNHERYEVVANFLSHPRNRRLRAICQVPADEPEVASLTDLYPGVNFPEREVYDLFGISFAGHPDLTRILMPDDWEGHPQRKDYPLGGVPVEYKGAEIPPPDQRRSYQ
jgi:NADH-quinone oxidoreductase subunit C